VETHNHNSQSLHSDAAWCFKIDVSGRAQLGSKVTARILHLLNKTNNLLAIFSLDAKIDNFSLFEQLCTIQSLLHLAIDYEHVAIVNFLRPYIHSKSKVFALCMGLHRRLGAGSPLNMLNVDVIQEISKFLKFQ
jgi:hypothetical protein